MMQRYSAKWWRNWSRRYILLLCCCLLLPAVRIKAVSASNHNHNHNNKLPEVSSTLLKLHKIYTSHPPHDTTLYNVLRVSPNCTLPDIQKSYRKLSRDFHPDKYHGSPETLQTIRQAYDILSHDATRMPYHKFGLLELSTAVNILTGYQYPYTPSSRSGVTPELIELLQLMGFSLQDKAFASNNQNNQNNPFPSVWSSSSSPPPPPPLVVLSNEERYERRVRFLAATILERIRPLVEGHISPADMAHAVSEQCDRLKTLPLGAHILRCVGRAYRHAGKGTVRRCYPQPQQQQHGPTHDSHHHYKNPSHKKRLPLITMAEQPIRDTWHDAKHFWTAVMAHGRVAWKERRVQSQIKRIQKQQQRQRQAKRKSKMQQSNDACDNNYDIDDGMMWEEEPEDDFFSIMGDDWSNSDEDEYDDDDDNNDNDNDKFMEQLKLDEAQKAQQVMIDLLQVEALWKVHKIGLDRAVREACERILSGQYFFFPSHQQHQQHQINNPQEAIFFDTTSSSSSCEVGDGWISAPPSADGGNRYRNRHNHYLHTNHEPSPPPQQQAINANDGRLRAAQALVLIGDVMVQCSKEGTAWME